MLLYSVKHTLEFRFDNATISQAFGCSRSSEPARVKIVYETPVSKLCRTTRTKSTAPRCPAGGLWIALCARLTSRGTIPISANLRQTRQPSWSASFYLSRACSLGSQTQKAILEKLSRTDFALSNYTHTHVLFSKP